MASGMKRDPGSVAGPKNARSPGFPVRGFVDYLTLDEALSSLADARVRFNQSLLPLLRLPGRLMRGINEKYEYFDIMSFQPSPYKPEDSPSFCYDNKLPAPSWVKERYLAVSEEGGKRYLIFIDVPRRAFVKEDIENQDATANRLYACMISGGR